jgi:acyl-ACP thioesterase
MKAKSTYTRRAIALMYFPESKPKYAVNRLTAAIRRCPELEERLSAFAPLSHRQVFSAREVRILFRYLGEP